MHRNQDGSTLNFADSAACGANVTVSFPGAISSAEQLGCIADSLRHGRSGNGESGKRPRVAFVFSTVY